MKQILILRLVTLTCALAAFGLIGLTAQAIDVRGPDLVEDDRPLTLRGVNRSGTEYACAQGWGIFDGPVDSVAIDAMVDWGVDTVRVPLNESCWLGLAGVPAEFSGDSYRQEIIAYVDRLRSADMKVILDLHWSDGGGSALGQQDMANSRHSQAFWADVARTFADRSGVMFEVFNEPHSIDWDCWLDGCGDWAGMQDLVDAIRDAGATQPIIVSGLEWGNDLRQWWEHRPVDPLGAIVVGVHVYDFNRCSDAACWDREFGPLTERLPMIISEFGTSDCTGRWATSLMEWADRHQVSYVAWSWNAADCAGGPSLIDSYTGTATAYGEAVRSHYRAAQRSNPFVDDDGSVHEENIERLAAQRITRGCNPPDNDRFCPQDPVTRAQAAAFLVRVLDLAPSHGDAFLDDDSSPFEPEIQALASAGVTRGCDPPHNRRFCGASPVTRGQWASFLARALGLTATIDTPEFTDLVGHVHRYDIERVAAAGLTRGCNPPRNDRFCPEDPVTRGQSASFLARLIGLRTVG